MKFNDREAQRIREPRQHQVRYQLGSVGTAPRTPSAAAPPVTPTNAPPAASWLGQLMQRYRNWCATRLEPKITTATDSSGQTWWQIYDPRTQKRKYMDSEAEVMRWLDEEAWL